MLWSWLAELNLMKFHNKIKGSNVRIDESACKVIRTASFCDAVVFSDEPVKINSIIPLRVHSTDSQFHGNLFLGVTARDPKSFEVLPKHVIGLSHEDDVWIKSLPSKWSNSRIALQLTSNSTLDIIAENEERIAFLTHLPSTSLWLILDLYGSTDSVHFTSYQIQASNQSTCPVNLMLLGPDVSNVLKCGQQGTIEYNKARIFLIGPSKSGKTTLSNALTNNFR